MLEKPDIKDLLQNCWGKGTIRKLQEICVFKKLEVVYFTLYSGRGSVYVAVNLGFCAQVSPTWCKSIYSLHSPQHYYVFFLHMPAGVPARALLTILCIGTLWDWQNQPNHLWNINLLLGWTVARAWNVSQLLSEPACTHAVEQVAPGTLAQGFSSLQSSKKTDTVMAKSSEGLIHSFL